MPKTRRQRREKREQQCYYANLEIIRLLMQQGYLEFETLVVLYQTSKCLHVLFDGFNILFPRYQCQAKLFYVNGTWPACYAARCSIYWRHEPFRRVHCNLPDALLANGHYELAIELIQHLSLPRGVFYRGIANDGRVETFNKFVEDFPGVIRELFIENIRAYIPVPKFGTSLYHRIDLWGSGIQNHCDWRVPFETMIKRHCLMGLDWCLSQATRFRIWSMYKKFQVITYCQLHWNDPEIIKKIDEVPLVQ